MTFLEIIGAYKLKKEMKVTGYICKALINVITSVKDETKIRKRAIKILDFIAPVKLLSSFPKTDDCLVIGFNHPSLGEIFRLIDLGFKYFPERKFLFPVNIPWYEALVPSEEKLEKMGIYIMPMITPSTEKKLITLCENDSERLSKIRSTKIMYEKRYMRAVKRFASSDSMIFVAPSATRQAKVIGEHIHPTMTILAHMVCKGNEGDAVFLPVTVFEPKKNNRKLNLFKTYKIYPCAPFEKEEVIRMTSGHNRDFDLAFLSRINEVYGSNLT